MRPESHHCHKAHSGIVAGTHQALHGLVVHQVDGSDFASATGNRARRYRYSISGRYSTFGDFDMVEDRRFLERVITRLEMWKSRRCKGRAER